MVRYWSRLFGKGIRAVLGLFPPSMGPIGVITWGLTGIAAIPPALAQSRDPIVTSDSPEYCGVLMNRISGITRAGTAPLPTEVAVLSKEGERMCVHGQTRGGILRLRRALEIMRRGED